LAGNSGLPHSDARAEKALRHSLWFVDAGESQVSVASKFAVLKNQSTAKTGATGILHDLAGIAEKGSDRECCAKPGVTELDKA
jgi:hypothetical protein